MEKLEETQQALESLHQDYPDVRADVVIDLVNKIFTDEPTEVEIPPYVPTVTETETVTARNDDALDDVEIAVKGREVKNHDVHDKATVDENSWNIDD